MDPLNQARMTAINVPQGSPPYQLAMSVCMIRGVDPYGFSMGAGLPNWQAVIMEVVLLETLSQVLR